MTIGRGRLLSTTSIAAVLAGMLFTPASLADTGPDDEVYSPLVEDSEAEFEFRAYRLSGNGRHENKATEYRFEAGYSPTNFWAARVEPVLVDAPDSSAGLAEIQFENVFQLTPANRYWADIGWLAEYDLSLEDTDSDEIELGPIIEKHFGAFKINASVFGERELASKAGYGLEYAWRFTWHANRYFAIGVQGFGEHEFSEAQSNEQDENRVFDRVNGPSYTAGDRLGPALFGHLPLGLSYQLGVLFGLGHGAATHTLRLGIAYER